MIDLYKITRNIKITLNGAAPSFLEAETDCHGYFFLRQLLSRIKKTELTMSYARGQKTISGYDVFTGYTLSSFSELEEKFPGLSSAEHGDYNYDVFGGFAFPSHLKSDYWKGFPLNYWFVPSVVLIKDNEHYKIRIYADGGRYTETLNHVTAGSENAETIIFPQSNTCKDDFTSKVAMGIRAIKAGKLEKIVLSRCKFNQAELKKDLHDIFLSAEEINNGTTLLFYRINGSVFISFTPETLLQGKTGAEMTTEALAGSVRKTGEPVSLLSQTLLSSQKDLKEHIFVRDHIRDGINNVTDQFRYDLSPGIRELKNIIHLHSGFKIKSCSLSDTLRIAGNLFPTPAVGGTPPEAAINEIELIEQYERGFFTGIIGYFCKDAGFDLKVPLRCGILNNQGALLFAGCGVVEDSDPESEFHETETKMSFLEEFLENANK